MPVDDEGFAFDIAQPAQLLPKRLPVATSGIVDAGGGTRRDDDRNTVLLRPLLRPHRTHGARQQQTDDKIPPPHSITSSASASTYGGMVRFSKRAVFRLM